MAKAAVLLRPEVTRHDPLWFLIDEDAPKIDMEWSILGNYERNGTLPISIRGYVERSNFERSYSRGEDEMMNYRTARVVFCGSGILKRQQHVN